MEKKKYRGIYVADLIIMGLDALYYFTVAFLVLWFRPSFDNKLGARTIILQMYTGFIIMSVFRVLFRVYRINKRDDTTSQIIRIFGADCVAVAAFSVMQRILNYVDRVEIVTVTLIVIFTMALSVLSRWIRHILDKRSIELSDEIPFSPPDISELEVQEVSDALRSGWITTGPRTKMLEKKLKEYTGADGCVCLNSNTACLEMALRILGIGEGDEVITCAYTYTASASPVIHVGAKLVLVDCSSEDGIIEMDYDAMEQAITPNTKAVIPVDLAGIPCDYNRIFEIVENKKDIFRPNNDIQSSIGRVAVIGDAAHALGAEYNGKMIGAVADFTGFSFHAVKNFTTGEGGAITWRHINGIDDRTIYKQIQLYSLHGQSKDALTKTKKGSWEYDILGPWYKCNMTDIAAAMGLAQFERYPSMLKKRRKIIEKYDKALKKQGVVVLDHYTGGRTGSGHLYITRIPGISEEERNRIITEMDRNNVVCNVHYKPLPMMTAYKEMGFDIEDYPNAYNKYCNEITLPLYSTLTDKAVDKIINEYTKLINH